MLVFAQDVGLMEGTDGNGANESSSLRLLGTVDVIVALAFVLDNPPVKAAKVLAIFVLPPYDGIFSKE